LRFWVFWFVLAFDLVMFSVLLQCAGVIGREALHVMISSAEMLVVGGVSVAAAIGRMKPV
jgi:hypothetical protein